MKGRSRSRPGTVDRGLPTRVGAYLGAASLAAAAMVADTAPANAQYEPTASNK